MSRWALPQGDLKPLLAGADAEFRERLKLQSQLGRLDGKPSVSPDVIRTLFDPAPNAIEWLARADYANNTKLYHFTRSYEITRDFFQLRCPLCNPQDPESIDCWGKTRTYLESEVLLRWSEDLQDDVCPKCRTPRMELIEAKLLIPYDTLHVVAGQRSGKTYTLAGIASFMAHWLVCRGFRESGGLSNYFGIGAATPLEFSFVAASKDQVDDAAWDLFVKMLNGSPWYRRFREWILAEERLQPHKQHTWKFNEVTDQIELGHPLLQLQFSALSSESDTAAGRTRIGTIVDEMGRMKQTLGPRSPGKIYSTQENSLATIRAAVPRLGLQPWIGAIMSCTSRVYRNGYEMHLMSKAEELPNALMLMIPTWEFNPDVPLESLRDKFVKEYAEAMLHFGCVVVEDETMLVQSIETFIPKLVRPGIKPTALFSLDTYTNRQGEEYVSAAVREISLRGTSASPEAPRVIAIDNGLKFDCLTLACAHGVWFGDEGSKQFVTVVDWVLRLVPRPGKPVRMMSVVDVVRSASTAYAHLLEARFDRWESATQIEILRDDGIHATRGKSPSSNEFRKFIGAVTNGQVWMPMPDSEDYELDEDGWFKSPLSQRRSPAQMSPLGAVLSELVRLRDDGVKVFNPEKGRVRGVNSDDAAMVLVRAHTMVQALGHVEDIDSQTKKSHNKRAEWRVVKPKDAVLTEASPRPKTIGTLSRPQGAFMPAYSPNGARHGGQMGSSASLVGSGMGGRGGAGAGGVPGIGLFQHGGPFSGGPRKR